jgi:putative solute:sodium symporter small subunit
MYCTSFEHEAPATHGRYQQLKHQGARIPMQPEQQADSISNDASEENRRREYWRANLRLVTQCLAIWFLASFGCGVLLAETLNQFHFFGFKLGFWFAQQGSIYVFLLLILFYVLRINALDKRFGVHEFEDQGADS